MNILVLNYEFPPLGGGASPVSYALARELVRKGHRVDVVTMHYRGLPAFEMCEGIRVHRVKCLRKYKELCRTHEMLTYVLSARLFLRTFLRDHPFDLCHCHFIIPTGIVAQWVKKKFGIPYVITSHGSDVPGYNPDRFQLQHKFTKPLLRSICADAGGLTTPSQYLADLIKVEIGASRIRVIPNGSRDFYRAGLPKENIIVSSGRLLQRKGFHLLIKAFDALQPQGWKLYIVGDGPYGSELRKLTANPDVVFTGWLDNTGDAYVELMNRASIFALLSSNESQGIVYIEAMSCGCVLLASDITACRETVTGDTGYRVSLDDADGIKRALADMIADEGKRPGFMVSARRRYLNIYQYEAIVEVYLELFAGVVTDIMFLNRHRKIVFLGKRKEKYSRIFVDLPHGLGDQIMCLPLFRSLKNKYPDAKITVFTPNAASIFLLNLFPYVDEHKSIDIKFTYSGVFSFFLRNFFPLRRYIAERRFDLYLAPCYNPLRGLFARVFPFPAAVLNKEHAHKIKGVENILACLDAQVDYDYSIKHLPACEALQKFGLEYQGYIVLDLYPQHLVNDPRGWPYFDELMALLTSEGHKIALVGLNDRHAEKEDVIDLVNKTTFPELLGVLQGAKLVVTLDSGLFHFTYCLGVPVIGLFGPVDPADRLPKKPGNVRAIYKKIHCSPCIVNKVNIPCRNREFPYECMKTIRPEEVMRVVRDVLKDEI